MWKFFNENKIFSLMSTQIVMLAFGIMITLPLDSIGLSDMLYLPTIFSFMLYLFLLYAPVWKLGSQDAVRISRGENVSNMKGIYIGLFANALNIILAILMGVFYLLKSNALCELIFTIIKLILHLGHGIYFGVVLQFIGTSDVLTTLFYLTVPFLSAAFISLFYAFGRKNLFIPAYAFKKK